ncbi:hypothetical protein QE152_g33826 [Popillia japonica]|uniref:Integrase catalytic domain-containing protein n=1 Tax=Popillia japonica TaxID=7064 RepID=A0AAW1IV75_POPJA
MGLPNSIVSDNGPPFSSKDFIKFCHVNGIDVLKSPPYHPQSNGLTERHVQHVKSALHKYLQQKSTLTIQQQIPKTFAVGEKVFVGKLGPYSEDKWKHGIIIKNVSAVTYLVEVEGKIMHKHANNLRAIRHPERDEEGKVTSELPTYVPPLPVIASNGIDTPLMAHDSNTEVANDVVVCNSPKEVSDRVEKPLESNAPRMM